VGWGPNGLGGTPLFSIQGVALVDRFLLSGVAGAGGLLVDAKSLGALIETYLPCFRDLWFDHTRLAG
jgi:hypothetical protein